MLCSLLSALCSLPSAVLAVLALSWLQASAQGQEFCSCLQFRQSTIVALGGHGKAGELKNTVQYRVVKRAVFRAGCEHDSPQLGYLEVGEEIETFRAMRNAAGEPLPRKTERQTEPPHRRHTS